MNLVELGPGVSVDLDLVTKVEFVPGAGPLGEKARLLTVQGAALAPAGGAEASTITALQKVRQAVGDGTGPTGWVRVRKEGVAGDAEDSYVRLSQVGTATLDTAADGQIARLKTGGGIDLGQVHLPAALQTVKSKFGLP